VDAHLLKLQRLENRVLHAIENLDRCSSVLELHVVYNIPYAYDNITKLCSTQAELILNHINPNACDTGQGQPGVGSVRGLNLAAVRPTTIQLTAVSE
jgi:hypothetical protein